VKVGDSNLGVKIFLVLLSFYIVSVVVSWLWNKIKLRIDKE